MIFVLLIHFIFIMIAESQIELRRGDVNQIYIKNGQRIPGFAIGIGHTNPGKHHLVHQIVSIRNIFRFLAAFWRFLPLSASETFKRGNSFLEIRASLN